MYLKECKRRNCGKVHQQHYTSIVLLLIISPTDTRIYNQLRTKWNKILPSIPTNSFFCINPPIFNHKQLGSFFRIPHLQVLRQYTKYLAFALHHKWSTWNLPDFHSLVLRVPKRTPRTRRNRRNRRWRLHHPRSVARDLADRSIDSVGSTGKKPGVSEVVIFSLFEVQDVTDSISWKSSRRLHSF